MRAARPNFLYRTLLLTIVMSTGTALPMTAAKNEADWKKLPVQLFLDKAKDVRYCETEAANKTKISVVIVPANKSLEIKPVLNPVPCGTSEALAKEDALASVNAGYFNLHGGTSGGTSGGASTGYITINGQLVCTPKDNEALTGNPKLKPFLSQIFDRSELRFIQDSQGKTSIKIQPHSEALPQGFTLKHALQAGPRLLPQVTAKEEAFLRTEPDGSITDSIGCLKTAGRTAFGITSDGTAIIVCAAGPKQDEFSAGMTLQQLADFMKQLGCVEAINFDGGTSTTMAIASNEKDDKEKTTGSEIANTKSSSQDTAEAIPADTKILKSAGLKERNYRLVCGRQPETHVKSCLVVKSTK